MTFTRTAGTAPQGGIFVVPCPCRAKCPGLKPILLCCAVLGAKGLQFHRGGYRPKIADPSPQSAKDAAWFGMTRLLLGEEGIDVGEHGGAGPVLGTDDFAVDAAVAANDVCIGIHGGAIRKRDRFGRVAEGGEIDIVGVQEFLVNIRIFVHADAEDGAATRLDLLLELIQRGRFVNAGRAPSGPEIEQNDAATQIGKMSGLAVEGEREIMLGRAAQAGFAVTIVRMRERRHEGDDEGESHGGLDIAF